jgi:hypothetical protein
MVAQNPQIDQARLEALGPAERIVQTLTQFTDHLVHNRPGVVVPDQRTRIGVRWEPVTWKQEDEGKVVYKLTKVGKKATKTRIGVLDADGKTIRNDQQVVGEYRKPGVFPEVATYLYRQVAEAYKLDNEFVARWASWAFPREHRDLKVVLAAFMLVQERRGDPVVEDGQVLFHDDDYRAVGEAMCLTRAKHDLNPKLLLRVWEVLWLEPIRAINRELGFTGSARNAALGRYPEVVTQWLRYRENNPRMLAGLVKAGFKSTVRGLAQRVRYKPESPAFYKALRWKQKQAEDGRRSILDVGVEAAESWEGLDEAGVCQRIIETKPNWKRLVGLLPAMFKHEDGMVAGGLTRAVMAAAIEAGSLSDTDLIILTPTLEELGLLNVADIKARWVKATQTAENQRAANIARNVKSKEVKDTLEDAADLATTKALAEVTKDLRIYVVVDISGSMQGAIEQAILYCTKFLMGFPMDRLHVSVFNTAGREVAIKHASRAGVQQAFRGIHAGGGTLYREGVRALTKHLPKAGEDSLIIFIGDEGGESGPQLATYVRDCGLNPVAFGLLEVNSGHRWGQGTTVKDAANRLQIPCFQIEEALFADPYAVTRTLQNLIASTPVGAQAGRPVVQRKTLVQQIMETPLLDKPVWASAA